MAGGDVTRSHEATKPSTVVPSWLRVTSEAWHWLPDVGLVGLVVLIIAGVWSGLSIWLALPAVLALLAGWDLARFALRRSATDRGRHLRWLALALTLGAVLAAAALLLRFDLGFGLALGLAVMLILLVTRAGRFFSR